MKANKKVYDYIFLDLDGPILDGKSKHYHCYIDIINDFGGNPLNEDEYWNLKRNRTDRKSILYLSDFQGSYDEFFNNWLNKIESSEYLKFDVLKPGVKEFLPNLKDATKNLVLVTMRNNKINLFKQLDELKIKNIFDDVIVCGSENINPKFEALKDLKFNSAVFIGDTEEDTKTAKLLNIKSIGILNGIRNKSNLDADYIFDEIYNISFKDINIEK